MGEWILLILSSILLFLGFIGCFLPVLPGPPLTYLAVLLLHFSRFADFSLRFLIVAGLISIAAAVADYVIPVYGTKKLGGSNMGTAGAAIGLIAGLFFPPWGIIAGPFAGAFIMELIKQKEISTALKSGLGSFLGFVAGLMLKLAVSTVLSVYFVLEIAENF